MIPQPARPAGSRSAVTSREPGATSLPHYIRDRIDATIEELADTLGCLPSPLTLATRVGISSELARQVLLQCRSER
jgi:hypothetical protein